MQFAYRLIIALAFLAVASSISHAQSFKFDVKTKFAEKSQLRVIKFGVMNAIDAAEWAENAETGEDYSLWLKELTKKKGGGDTMKILLLVELRTPAMMRDGDLITSKTLEVAYSSADIDSISTDEDANEAVNQYLNQHELIEKLTSWAITAMMPGTGTGVTMLATRLLEEVKREPTAYEIYESSIVGTEVLIALEEMLSE